MEFCRATRTGALLLGILFASAVPGWADHVDAAGNHANLANVPVVNCATGMEEKSAQPTSQRRQQTATVPAYVAPKLAYFAGEFGGMLAPRGWYCDSELNSAGFTLYAQPHRNDTNGPFVRMMIATSDANFSEKEVVATVAAHLFPTHAAYVKDVVEQEHENSGDKTYDIPIGPYPADQITRRSATVVEFVTPPNKHGMGTEFGIEKNASPVFGAAILASDDSQVEFVCVRLSDELKSLAPILVRSAEPRR